MALYNITTKQEFETKVLGNDKVVLVDFWAEWCPPCRAMAPILHAVADKLDRDVDIVKVNIEESPDNGALAAQYNIRSIPNMHVFKKGQVVDYVVGMTSAPALEHTLKVYIAKSA